MSIKQKWISISSLLVSALPPGKIWVRNSGLSSGRFLVSFCQKHTQNCWWVRWIFDDFEGGGVARTQGLGPFQLSLSQAIKDSIKQRFNHVQPSVLVSAQHLIHFMQTYLRHSQIAALQSLISCDSRPVNHLCTISDICMHYLILTHKSMRYVLCCPIFIFCIRTVVHCTIWLPSFRLF